MPEPSKRSPPPSIHLLAGGCAGFTATALLHPLDLIKTRLHVQELSVTGVKRRLPFYGGLLDACRSIYRLEGALGFYGGLAPNVVGNTGSWAVYMYAYNSCKTALAQRQWADGTQLYLTAATVAGAITTLLMHPVFTIKTRMQLQLNAHQPAQAAGLPSSLVPMSKRDNYKGSLQAVRRMVEEEGALSLYRGMGPSMLLVSHGSIQFLAYEHAKNHFAGSRRAAVERVAARRADYDELGHFIRREEDTTQDARAAPAAASQEQLGAYELLVASTGSKVCATLATYPYQVVRSCMQQRAVIGSDAILHRSTNEVVGHIWRADGLAGFYRGIWPHILRSTPQATITLMVYEYVQRALSSALGASRSMM